MRNILCLLLLLLPGLQRGIAQTVWHVDADAPGGAQNGQDWASAFSDLQSALAAASPGDAIWVAQGTYYPTNTANRSISFVLRKGVKLFGGFAGTESNLAQRQPDQHPTVLSGNIGDTAKNWDNTYSIVTGQGLDTTACLDGFILSGNYADLSGSALYLKTTAQDSVTCPVIRNCRFENNFGLAGAAMFCEWNHAGVVSPVLQNCIFRFNRAQAFGGAILKDGPSPKDHPFIAEDCIFSDNRVQAGRGGAIFFSNTSGHARFKRCRFERDSAVGDLGGAIYYPGLYGPGEMQLDSCIFIENYADEGAGICYDEYSSLIPSGFTPFSCKMNHCIFERNISRADGAAFYFYGAEESSMQLYLDHCLVKENRNKTLKACVFDAEARSDVFLSVRNTDFIGNIDFYEPGGTSIPLSYGVVKGKCRAVIDNCVFARNGGAAVSALIAQIGGAMESHITNCTFYQNHEFVINKDWDAKFNDSTYYDNMYIKNCIFWEDSHPEELFSDNNFMTWEMGGFFIDHILVKNAPNSLPSVIGPHVLYQVNPMFVDTLNNDFRLKPCSPAVNYGDNLATNSAGLSTDKDGNLRIFRDTVDLGAYEVQDTCNTVPTVEPSTTAEAVQAYPNPANGGDKVRILMPDTENRLPVFWQCRDAMGRIVREGAANSGAFDILAPATAGVYYLDVRWRGVRRLLRFIVK